MSPAVLFFPGPLQLNAASLTHLNGWMDGEGGRQARPPERHTAGDCKCLIVTESQFRSMDHFCSLEGLLVPFFVLPPSSFSALCNLYPQSSESNVGASRMSESLDGR